MGLISKFNFIIGMYLYEETQYISGLVLSAVSGIHWGLGMYPPGYGGTTVSKE